MDGNKESMSAPADSPMSVAPGLPARADVPVLRITPPAGWLELNLREVWQARELLYFFVWRDIKVRYKQTAIGAAWAVLQPLLTMLVFTLFFGKLAHIDSNGLPYPVFSYAGLLPWTYFATALGNATSIVVEQQRVITKVYFPRLILPLSAVLSGLVDFAIAFIVYLPLQIHYRIFPGRTLVFLPVFLLLAILTALAVGLWLSALNAIYRDVRYVMSFLIQFWMFASPVVYPSSLVPAKWRALYGLNPLAGVIEGFRWSLTGQGRPPDLLFAASTAMVLVLLLGGIIYFNKMETTIADVV
jgi:lipopolysaccharide transport system permease protein